ncbi:BGTF surface domain-containing protein [Halopenitus sp. POP-27]|uniref:BGTF surface domain-containing protein n=1 Tax=Halopenitus sp. POP-27 TaxID=2994425 RepID=UPI002469B8D1|nr:BGTF surface domain-containing protein [Halopenitus sp. POP-27]
MSLADPTIDATAGGIVELTVTAAGTAADGVTGNTPGATLVIGNETVGYEATVRITEFGSASSTTLRVNTATAGTTAGPVVTLAPVSADVGAAIDFDPETDQSFRSGGLTAGEYPIAVSAVSDPETTAGVSEADGVLTLTPASEGSASSWTTTAGTARSILAAETPATALSTAVERGAVTRTDAVAAGDVAVFRVESAGVSGPLALADRRRPDVGPRDRFGMLTGRDGASDTPDAEPAFDTPPIAVTATERSQRAERSGQIEHGGATASRAIDVGASTLGIVLDRGGDGVALFVETDTLRFANGSAVDPSLAPALELGISTADSPSSESGGGTGDADDAGDTDDPGSDLPASIEPVATGRTPAIGSMQGPVVAVDRSPVTGAGSIVTVDRSPIGGSVAGVGQAGAIGWTPTRSRAPGSSPDANGRQSIAVDEDTDAEGGAMDTDTAVETHEEADVTTGVTVVERDATFTADPYDAHAAPDQSFTGTTTLAPGTEFTVRLQSTDEPAPELRAVDEGVRVREDGTWTSTLDLTAGSVGDRYRVSIHDANLSPRPTVDGQLRGLETPDAAATVTPDDATVDGDTTPTGGADGATDSPPTAGDRDTGPGGASDDGGPGGAVGDVVETVGETVIETVGSSVGGDLVDLIGDIDVGASIESILATLRSGSIGVILGALGTVRDRIAIDAIASAISVALFAFATYRRVR